MNTKKLYMRILLIFISLFIIPMLSCTDNSVTNEFEQSAETLEDFFNQPLNKFASKQMMNLMSKDEDFYSVDIEYQGNRVIYSLHSKDYLGKQDSVEKTLKPYLEKNKGELFDELRATVDLEGDYEAEFIYYNNDYSKAADIIVYENEEEIEDITPIAEYSNIVDKSYNEDNPDTNTLQYLYENYYDTEDNEFVNSLKTQNVDIFSDIKIECVGNAIIYNFYFAEDMGDVQKNIEYNINDDEKNRIVTSIKDFFTFKDTIKVKYVYYNPDGSIAGEIESLIENFISSYSLYDL